MTPWRRCDHPEGPVWFMDGRCFVCGATGHPDIGPRSAEMTNPQCRQHVEAS